MNALKIVYILIAVFITLPISLWLQYQVLSRVQATELMMFLFWIYVPLVFVVAIVGRIVAADEAKK